MSEYSETIEERDGYRVRLEVDEDALFPDGDGTIPTLQIDSHGYGSYSAEAMNDQAAEVLDAFRRLCGEYSSVQHPLDTFERYLRIFHGATKVQTWNMGITNEYGYIGFDTPAWRELTGAAPETLQSEDYLSEVRDWARGEVYGYVVERLVSYTKTYEDGSIEVGSEWLEVEDGACWGFYGHEYAEESARQALADCITLESKP